MFPNNVARKMTIPEMAAGVFYQDFEYVPFLVCLPYEYHIYHIVYCIVDIYLYKCYIFTLASVVCLIIFNLRT